MSIVEQAAKRLEELERAGVAIPWAAAGLARSDLPAANAPAEPLPVSALRRLEAVPQAEGASPMLSPHAPALVPTPPAPKVREGTGKRSASVEIDLDRLQAQGYLVPSQSRSPLADEFRHIKRPLLKAARASGADNRGALIMVTSALAGEGKTFCSINLAMSMAMEVDTSVLLVDADTVRPTVLSRLGLSTQRGFLDALVDPSVELSDVMLRTNIPKLSLLPAGTPHARSTELLASAAMERMLVELATKYSDRVVIFDAPPLLLTTEARVLASRMGQVVVVVEASGTSRRHVAQAFAAVEQCPNVVSVLNKCEAVSEWAAYGGYYG